MASRHGISGLLNFKSFWGTCPQTPLATRACSTRFTCLPTQKFLGTAMRSGLDCTRTCWTTVNIWWSVTRSNSMFLNATLLDQNQNRRWIDFVVFLDTNKSSYPSGNVAVLITATEKGKFTYIVYEVRECQCSVHRSRCTGLRDAGKTRTMQVVMMMTVTMMIMMMMTAMIMMTYIL